MNREKQDSAYDILMITTAFLRRPPLWQRRVFRGLAQSSTAEVMRLSPVETPDAVKSSYSTVPVRGWDLMRLSPLGVGRTDG
jgi:hypothetical protein